MAILICGIVDGNLDKPREGTIGIAERGMTAIGYAIDDPSCLDDDATKQQMTERYRRINADYYVNHTVVPLHFGNIVDDEEDVRQFLNNATIQLKALIDKVKGKVQIVIQVSFDVQEAISELSKTVDISNKIAVGKAFFELSQEQYKFISQALKDKLSSHVADYEETVAVKEATVLINSYLVEKTHIENFDNALAAVAEQCGDFIIFNRLGPFPPFSFVTAEFNKGNFEVINDARLLLGLNEQCTPDEVKSSYRKMSFAVHPDRQNGDNQKMKALNDAYGIIKAYCNSSEESEYSFSKEAIERSFVRS